MDPRISNPPSILPYAQGASAPSAKEVLHRTSGLILGVVLGTAVGILAGVLVAYIVFHFTETRSAAANIGSKVAGTCFVIATFAAARLAVDLRFKKDWFVRGFLAGAAIPSFLVGLIFLLYSGW